MQLKILATYKWIPIPEEKAREIHPDIAKELDDIRRTAWAYDCLSSTTQNVRIDMEHRAGRTHITCSKRTTIAPEQRHDVPTLHDAQNFLHVIYGEPIMATQLAKHEGNGYRLNLARTHDTVALLM